MYALCLGSSMAGAAGLCVRVLMSVVPGIKRARTDLSEFSATQHLQHTVWHCARRQHGTHARLGGGRVYRLNGQPRRHSLCGTSAASRPTGTAPPNM